MKQLKSYWMGGHAVMSKLYITIICSCEFVLAKKAKSTQVKFNVYNVLKQTNKRACLIVYKTLGTSMVYTPKSVGISFQVLCNILHIFNESNFLLFWMYS